MYNREICKKNLGCTVDDFYFVFNPIGRCVCVCNFAFEVPSERSVSTTLVLCFFINRYKFFNFQLNKPVQPFLLDCPFSFPRETQVNERGVVNCFASMIVMLN